MLKYDNRYSMCIVSQENCAMLGKKCNRLLYVFSYMLSRNKTAGTSVEFFKDVLFSENYSFSFSLVPWKGTSLFYKVAHFTLRNF